MKARFELGQILRENKNWIENNNLNSWKKRTLYTLSRCRTAEMGGHIDQCNHRACGKIHLSYNSCRNRNCPKCQGHKRELWIQEREKELLPVGYFHVVFTLPSQLNKLAIHKPRLLYSTLFKTAWAVIKCFAENPDYLGARAGMIAILHTWGSNMSLHPHLHCIVPSGGMNSKGLWRSVKNKGDFLFPVKEMSKVFRAKFVDELRKQEIKDQKLFDSLFKKEWVVYAKKPFKNNQSVIEYLGRYTHKIAISNHRILDANQKEVSFKVRNYKKNGIAELLKLKTKEFIRRFAMHILPKGFVRIRHFGLLSSTTKRLHLQKLQKRLGKKFIISEKPKTKHMICPACQKGKLKIVCTFSGRAPPEYWIDRIKSQDVKLKKNKR